MKKSTILDKLGEMEADGKWKWFHTNRFGKELLIELIEYRIDVFKDFEIHDDGLRFRKIEPFKPPTDDITYKIEFRDQNTVQFDYSHLPDPKFTPENKIIKKRAI